MPEAVRLDARARRCINPVALCALLLLIAMLPLAAQGAEGSPGVQGTGEGLDGDAVSGEGNTTGPDGIVENEFLVKLDPVSVPGLRQSVRIRRDEVHVPHIFALNDHDALFMLGYVHAQDRFFQMDTLRRTFSGTLAELVGPAALASDVQLRTLGLRRGAEETWAAVSDGGRVWLEAYTAGVNAWLAGNALPPEYGALELTQAAAWSTVDSLVITKGLAFGLSFGLDDIDRTLALLTFQGTGAALGFDGLALFNEDLYRSAPFDDSISIPDFFALPPSGAAGVPAAGQSPQTTSNQTRRPQAAALPPYLNERSLALLRSYREKASAVPDLAKAFEEPGSSRGSNWWVVGGQNTVSGRPILANDPHLALDQPSVFYEVQMRVRRGRDNPAMNVFGVSFPGTPGVVLGCNPWICWGATNNPMDVVDVYQEQLIFDPTTGVPTHTMFRGEQEPMVLIPQVFTANEVGDMVPDNQSQAQLGPLDGGLTLVVPRRNHGPIVDVDLSNPAQPIGLSVQYTGWRATHEYDALRLFGRARTLEDFEQALQSFDVGSQNWSYADREGNIAYFTSAEMPLREDLQTLNFPDGGIPPWFLRDGTGAMQHEWLPLQQAQPGQALNFEVLPFAEMPQVVNPDNGYILNCNNDPVGTTLDNNPLNQLRAGGGIYYLSPGYAAGFRQGRLQRLVDDAMDDGPFDMQQLADFQGNHQLLDAELLLPYLIDAFRNANEPGVSDVFLDLIGGEIADAMTLLTDWNYSTPTGILGGYDPGDDPEQVAAQLNPTQPDTNTEIASAAATIYSVWRGQLVQRIIDGTLAGLGLGDHAPGSNLSMTAVQNLLHSFGEREGIGASGIDFFQFPGVANRQEARDAVLLQSLKDALALLAGDAFAPAFGNAADLTEYQWGNLHRITFDHPLGGPFSIPPDGLLPDLGPELPGIARSGGFGVLDASAHSVRADSADDFTFGSGPSRRFVGTMYPDGPQAEQVIPGGQSGVLGSPYQADQLRLWLTNQRHPFPWKPDDVIDASRTLQRFLPEGAISVGPGGATQ